MKVNVNNNLITPLKRAVNQGLIDVICKLDVATFSHFGLLNIVFGVVRIHLNIK